MTAATVQTQRTADQGSHSAEPKLYGASDVGSWVVSRGGDWQWGPFKDRAATAKFIAALGSTVGSEPYGVNLTDHPNWFGPR